VQNEVNQKLSVSKKYALCFPANAGYFLVEHYLIFIIFYQTYFYVAAAESRYFVGLN